MNCDKAQPECGTEANLKGIVKLEKTERGCYLSNDLAVLSVDLRNATPLG